MSLIREVNAKTRDSSGDVINPSTLEEQQQLTLIASAIQELVERLNFLPSVRGIAADLRVTLLSGTVSTVTTVTTVSTVSNVANQTQIGGYSAASVVQAAQNQAAILSCINNIKVS